MAKRGRKTKLNQELIDTAVDLLKMGNYTETVCDYLGIDESTWYRWMREGKKANRGIKNQFYQSIKKAQAHAEIRNLAIIETAAKEEWQAAAWYLERKFQNKWGRKKYEMEHTGEINTNTKIKYVTRWGGEHGGDAEN